MKTPFTRPANSQDEAEIVRSISREQYERCTYCNSKLIHSHDLNLSILQVIEVSRCPGCGVSMHPKKFTLQ